MQGDPSWIMTVGATSCSMSFSCGEVAVEFVGVAVLVELVYRSEPIILDTHSDFQAAFTFGKRTLWAAIAEYRH